MSALRPAPVNIGQFIWHKDAREFVGEISSTGGFGRVWNDSCDEGLTVVNPRTGTEVVFVVTHTTRTRDGEITGWELEPADDRSLDLTMILFND